MMRRIGYMLDDFSVTCLEFIDQHLIGFWVLGMILTIVGGVTLFGETLIRPHHIISSIALILIAIPSVGYMWIAFFALPFWLLGLLAYLLINPKEILHYIFNVIGILIFISILLFSLFRLMAQITD